LVKWRYHPTIPEGEISLYIEEDIPGNHLIRVVNAAINRLDDAIFDAAYPGGTREKEKIQGVVKYGNYHKETSKAWKENVGKIENWTYDKAKDTWKCPAGQTLYFRNESKEALESGYEIRKHHYHSPSFAWAVVMKERCTKAAGNREVVVSLEPLLYQNQARKILRSEEGYDLSVRRMTGIFRLFSKLSDYSATIPKKEGYICCF
jgi:hypothetical protein